MAHSERITAQIWATRRQLCGDREHLASLQAGLRRTLETVERAERAHAESVDLLRSLDVPARGSGAV